MNKLFLKKYPFYKIKDINGNVTGSWYDSIPVGWRKAFGKKLSNDLKASLMAAGTLESFRFTDIKEKWGVLEFYHTGCDEKTYEILEKYTALSAGYCMNCGKPAKYKTQGWISYLCESCFDKQNKVAIGKGTCRLTAKDIPITSEKADEYGINYYDLWKLEKEEKAG